MNVEQTVLRRILPTEDEDRRIREAVSSVKDILSKAIRKLGLKAQSMLVGSVGRGTYLKNPDIDVFILFPVETPRDDLKRHGLQLGQFLTDKVKMYAEHPYTRGFHKGFRFDIVPCYAITSSDQKMSAVDRTPFHTKYVLEKLKPDQRDQARLLKAFMKGIGVYGAEARVQGFSGYLCELLVMKYGSFVDALKAMAVWQAGNVIALETLPTRVFDEPLIVVDPVDGGRNVASAVSKEKMAVLMHAASEYLRKPTAEFFFPNPPPRASRQKLLDTFKERGTRLMVVSMKVPKITDDILYPQIRKALKAMEDVLSRHEFSFVRSGFEVVGDDALFMFELEVFELPIMKKHLGPPAWVKNAADFQAKWRGSKDAMGQPYIEEGQWVVDIKREQITAAQLIVAKQDEMSLGKDMEEKARGSLKVFVDPQGLNTPHIAPVCAFMDRKFPWER